jgi:preprotein translocase subunit SecB
MPENETRSRVETKKVYLKDASFESPSSPFVFGQGEIKPALDVQMTLTHQRIEDGQDYYEVVLNTTVTARQEEKTLFLAEIQQGGIFEITNVPDEQLEFVLETACPHILLPFAREAMSSLVSKGGFPQLLISPVNFERLHRQKQAREAQAAPASGASLPN